MHPSAGSSPWGLVAGGLVLTPTRGLETVLGLRRLGMRSHPHRDTAWFDRAVRWSRSRGSLLRELCAAPVGIPAFLLLPHHPELGTAQPPAYGTGGASGLWKQLTWAFAGSVPLGVERKFRDERAAFGEVTDLVEDYAETVLDAEWPRLQAALVQETSRLRATSTPDGPCGDAVVATVLGLPGCRLRMPGPTGLVAIPVRGAEAILAPAPVPTGLAALIGRSRDAVLRSLSRPLTATQIAKSTGERRHTVKQDLGVLMGAGLLEAVSGGPDSPTTYVRTAAGDLLV